MTVRLIATALLCALAGTAGAQTSDAQSMLGMPCFNGTDPRITGIPCVPVIHRNAIDEGRASTVLPKDRHIDVQNDPLGRGIGNGSGAADFNTGFGNPAIQLPKIR